MALVTRLSRLFQADFHAVLDRIEEPDLQLRQAVREMQLALDSDRKRLQLMQHELEQSAKAQQSVQRRLEEFEAELDICLAAEKEDLARDLIRRKLGAEKQLNTRQQQVESLGDAIEALKKQIAQQEQQLDSMQQKLDLLVQTTADTSNAWAVGPESIRNEEIEIALLREKQRRVRT